MSHAGQQTAQYLLLHPERRLRFVTWQDMVSKHQAGRSAQNPPSIDTEVIAAEQEVLPWLLSP